LRTIRGPDASSPTVISTPPQLHAAHELVHHTHLAPYARDLPDRVVDRRPARAHAEPLQQDLKLLPADDAVAVAVELVKLVGEVLLEALLAREVPLGELLEADLARPVVHAAPAARRARRAHGRAILEDPRLDRLQDLGDAAHLAAAEAVQHVAQLGLVDVTVAVLVDLLERLPHVAADLAQREHRNRAREAVGVEQRLEHALAPLVRNQEGGDGAQDLRGLRARLLALHVGRAAGAREHRHKRVDALVELHDRAVADVEPQQDEGLPPIDDIRRHDPKEEGQRHEGNRVADDIAEERPPRQLECLLGENRAAPDHEEDVEDCRADDRAKAHL